MIRILHLFPTLVLVDIPLLKDSSALQESMEVSMISCVDFLEQAFRLSACFYGKDNIWSLFLDAETSLLIALRVLVLRGPSQDLLHLQAPHILVLVGVALDEFEDVSCYLRCHQLKASRMELEWKLITVMMDCEKEHEQLENAYRKSDF